MKAFKQAAAEAASDGADASLSPMIAAQRSLIAELRDADWLTPERARAWCRILAAMFLVATVLVLALSRNGLDPLGNPLGTDFVSFWSASRLALDGQAAAVYEPAAHLAAQRALFPALQPSFYYAFFYPPSFLLICLPLALLPYSAALLVWLSTGFAALFACLRRILPQRWAILPIVAFPALLLNASHGQNGFLSAACLGWSMLLLQRRPFVAGMCLGALVFKPHLLLGAPIALLAARRWTAIAGAATSALGLIVLSWFVLGENAWHGFLRGSALARATLEQGMVEFSKLQSVFAAVRLLHGGVGLAYAVQILSAGLTCALLGYIVARRPGASAESALMVAASLLCTPFLLDYDFVCLALPIAWVMAEAQRTGWWPWEKFVLLAAYVLPLVSRPIAGWADVPMAPMVLAGLLLIVARRAWAASRRTHALCES
jgi:alpha-1,2-mannosyltransferase